MNNFKTKKVYLLDKNAIAEIKKSLDGVKADVNRLYKLKRLDKKGNFISCFLSMREGQTRKLENQDEIRNVIKNDSPYLKKFYTTARTDSDFFMDNSNFVAECFGHPDGKELNWSIHIKLIKHTQSILYQPIKKAKRLEVAKTLIQYAKNIFVPPGHLILICAIASLYGNSNASNILKAKPNLDEKRSNEFAYNSLSDLMCLVRTFHTQAHVGPNIKVEFVTFDTSLNDFYKSLKINNIAPINNPNNSDYGVEYNLTFPKDIFQDINQDEFDELTKLIFNT